MIGSEEHYRAVLFADISGSSALYKNKGDSEAKTIVSRLLDEIQNITQKHQGQVIKTIGDEVMACFSSGQNSVDAATAIQQSFIATYTQHHVMVSIGIAYGKVLIEDGDLFGETVNDAAYLTKLAKGGQILMSEPLLNVLTVAQKANAREFDRVTLKGAQESSAIFRLYWQEDSGSHNETQFLSTGVVLGEITKQILSITYAGREIIIEPSMTPFTLGRDLASCQIVLDSSQVSREHCHIIYNRGKFVLVDHSTNGCYLKPVNGIEFYLRREEFPIIEDSYLSLGVPTQNAGEHLIYINYLNNC